MSSGSLLQIVESEEQESASWIVTFADMMMLILVFFILLYTLSSFEDEAYRDLVSSVQVLDGEGNQVSVIDYARKSGRDPEPLKVVEDLLGLNPSDQVIELPEPIIAREIKSMVENSDLGDDVELAVDGDQINIQIDGRLLFESGSARLKDEARVVFSNLGLVFREYADYRVAIRGHTDDLDIQTEQFPSNWELSAVRATTVLRFFIQQGIDPERMTATGYADFLPLVANTTPENRARNRRVEFVLEKEKEN